MLAYMCKTSGCAQKNIVVNSVGGRCGTCRKSLRISSEPYVVPATVVLPEFIPPTVVQPHMTELEVVGGVVIQPALVQFEVVPAQQVQAELVPNQIGNPPALSVPSKPTAIRLDEMSESDWGHYKSRVDHQWAFFEKLPKLSIPSGYISMYLYHATTSGVISLIRDGGLQPRDPRRQEAPTSSSKPERYDASKDGYLSFATSISGTGVLSGSAVKLRLRVRAQDCQAFRKLVSKEVRTTIIIPPERLEIKDGTVWRPLR